MALCRREWAVELSDYYKGFCHMGNGKDETDGASMDD